MGGGEFLLPTAFLNLWRVEMMNVRYGRFLVQVVAMLMAFILQIGAVHLNLNLSNQIQLLDFGPRTFSIAFLVAILGIASGVVLALFFFPREQNHSGKNRLLKAIVLGILPAFAVVLKLIFAVGVVPFSLLRPFWLEVWEWAINSQVPPFWLGLVIGWSVKQSFMAR